MEKKMDLRTEAQKERDERNSRMAESYRKLREENPDVSAHRICMAIAEMTNVSLATVKTTLKAMGVIKQNALVGGAL